MKTRLFPAAALCLALVSCHSYSWELYSTHLEVVKSVAPPGKNIHVAKKDLEEKGYEVSGPVFPTKARNYQSICVYYGATTGLWDGIRYAADLPAHGPPGAIVVRADPKGKIRETLDARR